ncbi:MAG TPA: hypothetical protein VFA08_01410 [Actinomycetota bacterium]|jgi:hypothetical protein|nr:hypothetical protein [Actinomycetota bacterium]
MNDTDIRELLARVADEVPANTPVDPEPLLRRGYRRMAGTAAVGALGVACAIVLVVGGVGLIRSSAPATIPADQGQPTGPPETVTDEWTGPCMDSQDGPPSQVCLGPLEEGTYTSQRFEPAVTFTVPAGWNNPWDTRGSFDLWTPGWSDNGADQGIDCRSDPMPCGYLFDQPGLTLIRNVRALEGCSDAVEAGVGTSALQLATWVSDHPGIATDGPSPVEIGGLAGYQLDVSIAETWHKSCPGRAGFVTVEPLEGAGLTDGAREWYGTSRLILLDLPDGDNVLIQINGTEVDAAMPVVRSFAFDVD